MTLIEAIQSRHSVRRYKDTPLPADVIETLLQKISEVNKEGGLHIQLVTDEPKAFRSILNYGTFSGVTNYFVVAGQKAVDLEERAGTAQEHTRPRILLKQLKEIKQWKRITKQHL